VLARPRDQLLTADPFEDLLLGADLVERLRIALR
jgi:hypothetical protein